MGFGVWGSGLGLRESDTHEHPAEQAKDMKLLWPPSATRKPAEAASAALYIMVPAGAPSAILSF